MSEWTIETLKELVESRLTSIESSNRASLLRVEEKALLIATALEKQAHEYERRLSDINKETDRLSSTLQTRVSREVYDLYVTGMEQWRQRVENSISLQVGRKEAHALSLSTIFSSVVVVTSIAVAVAALIHHS